MDVQVHAYGDIAVANFRTELDQDWSGQKLLETSRFTDVFARRGGRWLLVAHHETPIPNARRVAVKVDQPDRRKTARFNFSCKSITRLPAAIDDFIVTGIRWN